MKDERYDNKISFSFLSIYILVTLPPFDGIFEKLWFLTIVAISNTAIVFITDINQSRHPDKNGRYTYQIRLGHKISKYNYFYKLSNKNTVHKLVKRKILVHITEEEKKVYYSR
jgi:hypothetical protein